MSDELLSEEQIDALFDGRMSIDKIDESGATETTVDYAAFTPTLDLFNKQAESVISSVVNREITLSTVTCSKADPIAARERLTPELLALNIPFVKGIRGDLHVLISKKVVAVLSDLMMMGDGAAEYVEDHRDAIQELFNQIMGAFTTALADARGETIGSGAIEVVEFDFEESSVSFEAATMAILKMVLPDLIDAHIVLISSDETIRAMTFSPQRQASDDGNQMRQVGLSIDEMDDLSGVAGGMDDFRMDQDSGGGHVNAPSQPGNIEMLLDVVLDVSIELGATQLSIKKILDLAPGAVVELNRMAGEPVSLKVNDKEVARGEVVIVDENFGIRLTSLVSPEDRIRSLR